MHNRNCKNSMRVVLFFLMAMVSCYHVQAQSDTVLLTFSEAVKIGLDKNVTLNQQKNTLYSRQVQRNQSRAAFLPSLGVQGLASRTDGKQPNPDGGELIDLTNDYVNASIGAEMTLFNGFTQVNTLQQSSNQFKAQTALVSRTEQDVIFNVTTQYLQVLLDQELLKIAKENYTAQKVLLDQLKEQVEVGARAEASMYAQAAQVSNMELIALRAQVTLDNDKATLSQTLQLDPAIPFKVDYPAEDTNVLPVHNLSADSLFAVALTHRQDLMQAMYQMEANERGYKASSNGYYPNVSLFASYGSEYISSLKDQPEYGGFNNQFGKVFPSTRYGVNLTIPIFDRMVTRNTRVFNRVQWDNSKIQYENLKKTVKIDVQKALNNYKAAIQAYQASQVQLQAGELTLATQQESFILGVTDQVALAQANQTYVLAAASRAQAVVTLIFQKILLDYALGTLKPEDVK